jgi:hypothetical protein
MSGVAKWLPAGIGPRRKLEPKDREDSSHPDDANVLDQAVLEPRHGGL